MHADLFGWGTATERERRIRIKLCVAAYCYEVLDAPVMSDAAFDALAYSSHPWIITGHLDQWWRDTFRPYTGQWILSHPELTRVAALVRRIVTHRETDDVRHTGS